ncbi:Pex24p-domain-containing protein [Wilcoxina mikolae CBS 423.85]|nr:Pex24p-domain-containing protein [Wilcoxina mikolae CBS 423.85]
MSSSTDTATDSPNAPPTIAAFSPASASVVSRSTFQVHQKSPLLVATPPQVTRALSKAFPWIQQLDNIFALLTWDSKDPWESFLVVAAFWGVALYGDTLLRWAGNICVVALLIAGMFLRRYYRRDEGTTLDDILATLNRLNHRVDVFLSPCVTLLNIFSSEKNATTATTRPALTTLFIRILLLTPIWLAISIWPLHIITPRRIVLFSGTLLLSWHSRPAKVSRTLLWRSTTLRIISQRITGLTLSPSPAPPALPPRASASTTTITPATSSPGVKFTFAIFENERRWLGIGWTATMFPSERAAWTDEHLSPCPPPNEFQLPETPAGSKVRWRWVVGEEWEVEGATGNGSGGKRQELKDRLGGPGEGGEGWWYYDNKWHDGRRGVDGWGKYTRRRKWVRRAELVEDDGREEEEVNGKDDVPKKATPPPLPPRERLEEDARDSGSSTSGSEDGGIDSEDGPVVPPPLPR